ncbi:hypothetical protein LAZ67_2000320 [Cordylochernes scorpioides]|uniref:SLC41A/MgtE integral membrane domain-containing protein n=1 Tax=Cordylochernes scorpioides TaxID=51811 RepID=A0ABY6K241_9ARAC|nr:hypothetical protein LAZ67_2000320 [Cordylochernes scorpioides]
MGTSHKDDNECERSHLFPLALALSSLVCGGTGPHWQAFLEVTEIFILVPALLGLKGNLEMTLASRLSTQANLGRMDRSSDQWLLASGNMALIQCQALVVGFSASMFAVAMEWIPKGYFNWSHVAVLVASSVVTASLASLILGALMVAVVIVSRKLAINPDNVATPIAASLGDLTTLVLLALLSTAFLRTIDTHPYLAPTIAVLFLLSTPVWALIARGNVFTYEVLYTGWVPVIAAMIISSIGGCILNVAVSKFRGIAVFQPVINGVGGNLVAVQASRISTYFHQRVPLGRLPREESICLEPCTVLFSSSNLHSRTGRLLLAMAVPGHLIFVFGIRMVQAGHTSVTPVFLVAYLLSALVQVALLLYAARVMVSWMWHRGVDPDNSAIPYLTALGDLLGTALLAVAFVVLFAIGDQDSDANLGRMDRSSDQWLLASGNMALIQCQALVVGFSASMFAVAMEWIPKGYFNWSHVAVLVASSVVTASLASLILGALMVAVVIVSRKLAINPDNVATPIAASLGDLTTLVLLALLSTAFLRTIDTHPYLAPTIAVLFLLSTPVWALIARGNVFTYEVLYTGWVPVIAAMIISSIGGCILNVAVSKFRGIAVFQPVINGVGGNLVAVQASRISTYFHQRVPLGRLPREESICLEPCTVLFSSSNLHSRTGRLLLAMAVPGHLIFVFGIRMVQAGHTSVTPVFLVAYLLSALVQVALLLYAARVMVSWMWHRGVDPDNSAIPYLTALGDLLGTALLAVAFVVLFAIGDQDSDVGD